MIKLNKFIILLSLFTAPAVAQIGGGATGNTPSTSHGHTIAIGQSDISSGKTYTISTSGAWYLSRILEHVPTGSGIAVIKIDSDNVVLNLGGQSIVTDKGSATGATPTFAIEIASGRSNIQIFNGIIQNTSGAGILIGSGCKNIHLNNLVIHDCDEGGIVINDSSMALSGSLSFSGDACDHIYVTNCTVNNCNGTSTKDAYGLKMVSCKHVSVENCEFSMNTNSTSGRSSYGVSATSCDGVSFSNCFTNHNTGVAASYGFQLTSSSDCSFQNCFSGGHSATAGSAVGFDFVSTSANRLSQCEATNNTSVGGDCYGFAIDSSSLNSSFEDCKSFSNSSDANTYGFNILGNGCELTNCKSNQNSSSSTSSNLSAGYNITSNGNIIKNCVANQNKTTGTSSTCDTVGFNFSSANYNMVSNCIANANTTTGADTFVAGFKSSGGKSNRFEGCDASGQNCSHSTGGTAVGPIVQYACGFLFAAGELGSSIISCNTNNNNGGNGYGIGFGIYLQGDATLTNENDTTAPANTFIKNCEMRFNTSDGTDTDQGNKYGFFDEAQDTTSVLISNVSIGHGRSIATIDSSFNFIDPIANTARTNGMNYMFYYSGIDENPMNIIHETDISNWTTISTTTSYQNLSIVTNQVT